MKSLQFFVPANPDENISIQEDIMTHFYPHFHRHEETQLMWIVKGRGTLAIEENLLDFKDGDLFYLGRNQSHVFRANFKQNEKHKVHTISIFFDPYKKLSPLFEIFEFNDLKEFITASELGFKVDSKIIADITLKIKKLQKMKGLEKMLCFLEILNDLLQNKSRHTPLSTEKKLQHHITDSDKRIINAQDFIKQHFTQPNLSLNEVAAQACLTPQAFCRSFKKHTGNTYVQYINELRIQKACKLLTSSRLLSIASVAFSCGFNSLTNFNRVFRAVTNYSPKEYLKHYKETIME